ncbi:DinB family protein [bacterium SCSIO 12643]|nr:DinB family protein [bacterium SCSIO 12643]
MNPFDINRVSRQNILKLIDGLSVEQLNKIPEGYNNNIIWHVGHLIATQQLLIYRLSNTEVLITENIIDEFRKGTKPEKLYSEEDIQELKSMFIEIIHRTEQDYNFDVMNKFTEDYPTSYGVVLKSVDDAVKFNNIHEGLHLGYIMAMRKLV